MAIKDWSDNIILGDLQDDPQFSDDLNALSDLVQRRNQVDVVLDFSGVSYLNSSNIDKLLKLRKLLVHAPKPGKLKICAINTSVWGVFLVTGLDKIFDFCDDVPTGLASVQMNL